MQAKTVEISKGLTGFLAAPDVQSSTAIVLIQEIFGVNAYIRSLAKEYAGMGYTVLAPDLFWRSAAGIELDASRAEDREQAMQLNAQYNDDDGMQDLRNAIAYLRQAMPTATKIGAIGYCLGGRLAYKLGKENMVDAAVAYYGVNIQKFPGDPNTMSPTLIHIAGSDHLCPPEAQQEIVDTYKGASRVHVDIHKEAGHGFARPGSQHYSESATSQANARTTAFLQENLK
ncbi:dienelactone hydrolase family protein [Herbaspirillum lusitanum]|uniref:dienelactone hydrolase family protein n=1 Tax=Herbaspirillum lusitanum TaxID=213312 RepID=UPI000493E0A3|nr:dienelactone hydrolase family protein [Herbaspirillum lusitanum]